MSSEAVHEVEPLTWKHFRYAYQREYRLAWVPSSPRHDLTALDVSVENLTDIAEIAQPIESSGLIGALAGAVVLGGIPFGSVNK